MAVKSSGIFNIIMIDIEIKPPSDLNGTYTCYYPYVDYDNIWIWHKSVEKNINRIYYSEKYEVYYSIFKDNLKKL